MGKTKEKITVEIPKELIDKISKINNVDEKYIDRTIIRILKDEIQVEERLKELKKEKGKE